MNRKIHFILNYIKSKKKSFLMVLVCSAIFAFTFWMYGVTVAAVLYPALVCMVIMAAAFAIMARTYLFAIGGCVLRGRSNQ